MSCSPAGDSIAYTATKHAVTGLTKPMALDGRGFDIACGRSDVGSVLGDLLEIDTIVAAMQGVAVAYFVWPVRPGLLTAAVNFAQAAKEVGALLIVTRYD